MKEVKAKRILTEAQQKFHDSVLPKRYKKKEVYLIKIMSRTEYMTNCIYWLNEYYMKRCTHERALSATAELKGYCEEIINELQNKPYQ